MTKKEFEDRIESSHPGVYFFLTVDTDNETSGCHSMTYAYRKEIGRKRVNNFPPNSVHGLMLADYALVGDKVLKDRMRMF